MNKKVYSAVILLSLATPAMVGAAESAAPATEVHGSVELGVRASDVNGDEARLNEFRDLDDSVLGTVQLDALKEAYYFQFDGSEIGTDYQSFQFKGGEYNTFKYKFNYDEMAHNYLFDAISANTGIGTQHITPVADPTDTETWTHFDYAVDHKKYGGEIEVSLDSPYFVNIGVERREQDGLRPLGNYHPGTYDVAEPISNSTNNLHLQAGYRGEMLTGAITGALSSFENDNYFMSTLTPDTPNDYATFAPDNDYKKIGGDLSVRKLPLNSVISAAASYSKLDDSYTASELNLSATNLTEWNSLNTHNFNGEVDYTSFSLALSSNPLDNLDTKIYYNYLDRDNKSDRIIYTTHDNFTSLLSYEKNTAGVDLGYRLPVQTKLEAGYDYADNNRSTNVLSADLVGQSYTDVPNASTKDNTVYLGVKNSSLEWLTAKVRYTHLNRNSDTIEDGTVTTPFYYQDQSSNAWKVGFELYPVDRLDFGVDYTYKRTKYDNSVATRDKDTRHSVGLDATWHVIGKATLSGSVGYEKVETDTKGIAIPQTYAQTTDEKFWSYGVVANVPGLMDDKLTLNLSWQHQKSDGEIDFDNGLTGTTYENIDASDDYTRKTLEAKAIYAIDPKLEMTIGYIYEKFDYTDIATLDYSNYFVFDATHFGYFSGLNADPNYEANVGYMMVKYGF